MTGISQVRCALDGIRVLDLTRLLPGPFCTLLLADMGAEVIKIEDPSGGDWLRDMPPLVDGTSALFSAVNRNKQSVAINLKSEPGVADFLRLVESADVVVEGFRPGVIDRLGIGWDAIHDRNPRTVLVSISGYGQDGPYRNRAGHDLSYLALSGVLSLIRDAEGRPVIPGVQIGDIGGGALYGVVATLSALLAREKTGEGQWCDVSMVDGLMSWVAPQVAAEQADTKPNDILSGEFPCYSVYPCSDGYITVAAIEPQFWQKFVETMGMPVI